MSMIDRRRFMFGSAALSVAGALPGLAFAQSTASDTELVGRLLRELHPGLYRYQSRAEFDRRFDHFTAYWWASDFDGKVRTLSHLLSTVRCGHTHINFYNQSDQMRARLFEGRNLLPLHFRWLDGRMVATDDPYDTGIAPGTVIEKIDGRETADILAALMPYARADGSNDAKRAALMEVNGQEYPAFDLYYSLLFAPGRTLRLEWRKPDGASGTGTLRVIDRAERVAVASEGQAEDRTAPIWSSELHHGGKTTLMTMPTWVTWHTKWDWEGWLRGELARMIGDGTTGLVFDLRGNEGGTTLGEGMMPFLIDSPVQLAPMKQYVAYRTMPEDLRPVVQAYDDAILTIGKDAPKRANGLYELPRPSDGVLNPEPANYSGKIAIIVGPDNSSATFSFARAMQDAGRAVLVGEPTGGNLRGINGGAHLAATLPQSGIEFDIPVIGYYFQGNLPDHGLLPDIPAPQTPATIASGADPALERALRAVAPGGG